MTSSQDKTQNGVTVPVSPGELIDKITILEIKAERIADPAKLVNVRHQLTLLEGVRDEALAGSAKLTALADDLRSVNSVLWDIEDDIRACEATKDFGSRFIELARSVYRTNDKRAALKKEIDELFGSAITEEKSYEDY